MKTKAIFVLFLLVSISIIFSSCEKFSGDTDSISGAWKCYEDSEYGFKNYSVSIFRAGSAYDSTYFIINNFNNLGTELETLVQLKDTVITIKMLEGFSISGTGHATRDFKEIIWEYNVSGSLFEARYSRQ